MTNPTNPFAAQQPAPQAAPQMPPQAAPQMPPQAAPQMPPQAAPQMPPQAAPMAAPQMPPQAAPMAAPQMPPQAAPMAAAPAPVAGEKKARKKPNRQMTEDERKYVLQNYKSKSTSQIAQELSLTRQQVYRTIHEARTKLKERRETAQTENNLEAIAKIDAILADLPAKAFGGGQGKTRGSSVDNVLDDLLS